jgi:hypothetical protein
MQTRTAALALLILAPVSGALASDTPFDTAKAQGREDSTNPMYQEWYLGEMRPAFTPVFQASLGRCASLARGDELASLGLVFVVKPDGTVGDFFASSDTHFARCLEETIRGQTYPQAPKDGFYFGLDFAPQPTNM